MFIYTICKWFQMFFLFGFVTHGTPAGNGSDQARIAKRCQGEIGKNHLGNIRDCDNKRACLYIYIYTVCMRVYIYICYVHRVYMYHIYVCCFPMTILRYGLRVCSRGSNWLNQTTRNTALKLVPACVGMDRG